MYQVKWSNLLQENKETILEAVKKAYRKAGNGDANSGWQEVIDINRHSGKVSIYTLSQGSTCGEVWNGDAMEIHRFKWFDPMDGVDGSDAIEFLKSENLLDKFVAYLIEEEHINPDEVGEEIEIARYVWAIQDWKPEVWKQYRQEIIDWLMESFDPDKYFQEALERAREYDHDETMKAELAQLGKVI